MARKRTGTLVWRNGIAFAHVTATVDGKSRRLWFCLHTSDPARAERMLNRLVADINAGNVPLEIAATRAAAPDTVEDYATKLFELREARGIVMTSSERSYFKNYIRAAIGPLALASVRPASIRGVLDAVIAAGHRRATVVMVRSIMHRIFAAAWRDELITENPVARVEVPHMHEVKKTRVILTDEELTALLFSPKVDLEIKMMSLVARTVGGMRTGDLVRWDWSMIDRVEFAEAFIPRSKTGTPDRLEVPKMVRVFLRVRWESMGKPESGPVFPIERKGRIRKVGQARGPLNNSFADRLRRNLFKAGVVRMPPVEVPRRTQGTRTDLDKESAETMLAPNPFDPLYFETATTLPVDFHSFRRAFNTALAAAGVNAQQAMLLAHHADMKTHMRYVQATPEMRRIPERALPQLHLQQPVAIDPSDDQDPSAPSKIRTCDPWFRSAGKREDQSQKEPQDECQAQSTIPRDPRGNTQTQNESQRNATENEETMEPEDQRDRRRGVLAEALAEAAQAGDWAKLAVLAAELRAMRRDHGGR